MRTDAALVGKESEMQGPLPRRILADKIASSTVNLKLDDEIMIREPGPGIPRPGDVVAVRTLSDNANYNQLELDSGRLARINPNDVIVGVLGSRRALKGFVGDVPGKLHCGDRLHLLNLGGVVGRCTGYHHKLGTPIEVELLGMVERHGRQLNIGETALPVVDGLGNSAPLIIVAGTCMNSGKTEAANQLIKHFHHVGWKIAAGKLSGVACLRDTLNMKDHGAVKTLSFLDCGFPSTVGVDDLGPLARTIVSNLNQVNPDGIVLELGDGLLGGYHVESVLDDRQLMRFCAALVFCAGDFVGAWGGLELLRRKGIQIDVVSGSTTDSQMGVEFIEREFGIPAANALNGGRELFEIVSKRIETWLRSE